MTDPQHQSQQYPPQQQPWPPPGPFGHQTPPHHSPYPQQQWPVQQWPVQQWPQPHQPWTGHPADPTPRFQMRLTEHTGAVILWSQRRYTVVGTIEECEAAYRRAQNHCLGAGWWSLASLILFNWIAIAGNRSAIRAARRQAIALGWSPHQR